MLFGKGIIDWEGLRWTEGVLSPYQSSIERGATRKELQAISSKREGLKGHREQYRVYVRKHIDAQNPLRGGQQTLLGAGKTRGRGAASRSCPVSVLP